MGVPAPLASHARHRDAPRRRHDFRASARDDRRPGRAGHQLILLILLILLALLPRHLSADTIRVATFNAELSADGPGLLLRDILDRAPRVRAVSDMIAQANPDIIALQGIDYDAGQAALSALVEAIGTPYPYRYARPPNAGMATGLDLDGNGRRGDPRDAQGYGLFAGNGGMAILSRLPILDAQAVDLTPLLWRDLPGADPPMSGDAPFPSVAAADARRLSSVAHWIVPVAWPGGGTVQLMAWHATPPVFDGPEDLNGRRNHDETALWLHVLDGTLPGLAPDAPAILLGDANLDPVDGAGRGDALRALLTHPRLTDPRPGAPAQGPPDPGHRGPPDLDTAHWPTGPGPGQLRVSYILPTRDLTVADAGLIRPDRALPDDVRPRHSLVWVDLGALP